MHICPQVSHETWFNAHTHYLTQTRTYMKSWERSRAELCEYVRTVFQESRQAYENMQTSQNEERGTNQAVQATQQKGEWSPD